MSRHTWKCFTYDAECEGCDFRVISRNALGLAAQHHDKTGHSIQIEVEGHVSYLNDVDNVEAVRSKANQ